MRNTRPLQTQRYIWVAILAFSVLGLRVLNVAAFAEPHKQLDLLRHSGITKDNSLFTANAGENSVPLAPIRGGNSGLPLAQPSSMFAVQLLSYSMPPENVGPLAVSEPYAYVSELSDVDVFDVSNPVSPTLVNTYQSDEMPFGPVGMIISGTILYVAYSSADLHILDISQPMSPTLVGFYDGGGYGGYAGMMRVRNYLYLTTTSCALLIIDVSTASIPTQANCWNDVQNINAMYADDRYIYVAESLGSPSIVHILDISDPTNPTPIGAYPGPWPISSIVSMGDYLYVDNLQGFYIVDISSPSTPSTITYYPLSYSGDIHIIDSYMYLATGGGLLILDISDPLRPIQAGQGVLPWAGAYLTVVGQHVYMTDENVWGWGIKFGGALAIFETHELINRANLPMVFR